MAVEPHVSDDIVMASVEVEAVDVPWAIDKRVTDLAWWNGIPWKAMHDRIRTILVLPGQLHVEIADIGQALAESILQCRGTSLADASWKAFIMADGLLFHTARPRRGGKRGQGETLCQTISRRISAFWRGDWMGL